MNTKKLTMLFAVVCMLAANSTSCAQTESKTTSTNYDTIEVKTKGDSTEKQVKSDSVKPAQLFEIDVAPPSVMPGDYVLCPSRQFYDAAVKNGVDRTTFIYYAAKLVEAGETESRVANLAGREFEIPNQLIISISPKQECKKGDILLSWWQSGSGMQRAIVVGGTKTEPVVRYLDIKLDNPSGWGKKEDTLKPDSFALLNKQWQIGSAVRFENGRQKKHGLIMALSDDHVLVREFAGKMSCHDRGKVTPVPIVPDVVAGDIAMAAWHGSFKPVTVIKVDAEIGRVWTNFQLGRKDQEKILPFGDIYKRD